jgi:TonB family protein
MTLPFAEESRGPDREETRTGPDAPGPSAVLAAASKPRTMAVLAIPEEIASRFAPYIGELHELFAMHGISYGAPGDLPRLAARLDERGPLSDDVSSILRSIILREGGTLPHAELIEILALAVAGHEIDTADPTIQPAFRRLLTFVGTVVRRPWNMPPGDEQTSSEKPAAYAQPPEGRAAEAANATPLAVPTLSAAAAGIAAAAPRFAAAVGRRQSESDALGGVRPAQTTESVRGSETGSGIENRTIEAVPEAAPAAQAAPGEVQRVEAPLVASAAGPTRAPIAAEGVPVPGPSQASPPSSLDLHPDPYPDHEGSGDSSLPPVYAPRSSPSIAPLWIGALCAVGLAVAVAVYSHDSLTRGENKTAGASESITLPEPVQAPAPKPTADLPASSAIAPPTSSLKPTAPVPSPTPPAAGWSVRKPAAPAARAPTPAASSLPSPATPAPVTIDSVDDADSGSAEAEPSGRGSEARSPLPSSRGAAARVTGHGGGPYFLASSGIMASHLIHAPEPGYPTLARLAHIQGQVIVQAVISTEGQVIATRVLSGHRLLRGAAISAVKQWRYRPYIIEGHPVNVATIVTVDFHSNK